MNNRKKKWKKILKISLITLSALVIIPLLSITALEIYTIYKPAMDPIQYEATPIDYYPTEGWQVSTPEEQGMDSGKLLEMAESYQERNLENEKIMIDSVTVIRNGYIVSEMYFNPLFPKDTKHILHSSTKSIMSSLIGIAIDKGYIEGVDVPAMNFFDDKTIENMDDRWNNLTLKHTLAMQTGLKSRDSYLYGYEGLDVMQKTDDWVEYILSQPFEEEPGKRFEYSNFASFLLAAILQASTGADALEFAKENLFFPLGIEDVQWERSPKGIAKGWARMWLKPNDMAKIGQLYLQKGNWDGEQIISSEWIDETLTAYSSPKKYRKVYDENGRWDLMASGGDWVNTFLNRPFADGYGYQWWLDKSGTYSAVGTGGQYIIVVPKENLVIVFTGKMSGTDAFYPAELFEESILSSIVSNEPLPSNVEAQKKLALLSEVPELIIEREAIKEMSNLAYEISGKTYELGANYFNYSNLKFEFEQLNSDFAQISYNEKEGDFISYQIGLDNSIRLTESNGVTYASFGYWINEASFVVETEVVGYSTKDKWAFTFEGDTLFVEETGVIGVQNYEGELLK